VPGVNRAERMAQLEDDIGTQQAVIDSRDRLLDQIREAAAAGDLEQVRELVKPPVPAQA
jgi:predicted lipid-binding transport protein (Tim44 family)